MNIDDGIYLKKLLQKLLEVFYRFYKKEKEIEFDLEHTADVVTKVLCDVIRDVEKKTKESYQAEWFSKPLYFALWISTKDTAYTDQRDYAIYKVLTEYRDVILNALEEKRKIYDFLDNRNWHINQWYESKKKTKKLRKKGLILDDMVSGEEAQFINEKHIDKINETFIK